MAVGSILPSLTFYIHVIHYIHDGGSWSMVYGLCSPSYFLLLTHYAMRSSYFFLF